MVILTVDGYPWRTTPLRRLHIWCLPSLVLCVDGWRVLRALLIWFGVADCRFRARFWVVLGNHRFRVNENPQFLIASAMAKFYDEALDLVTLMTDLSLDSGGTHNPRHTSCCWVVTHPWWTHHGWSTTRCAPMQDGKTEHTVVGFSEFNSGDEAVAPGWVQEFWGGFDNS